MDIDKDNRSYYLKRDFDIKLQKLQQQCILQEQIIHFFELDTERLCLKITDMKNVQNILSKNLIELLELSEISKAEIDTRDHLIIQMRKELDDYSSYHKHKRRDRRSTSLDEFDFIKTQKQRKENVTLRKQKTVTSSDTHSYRKRPSDFNNIEDKQNKFAKYRTEFDRRKYSQRNGSVIDKTDKLFAPDPKKDTRHKTKSNSTVKSEILKEKGKSYEENAVKSTLKKNEAEQKKIEVIENKFPLKKIEDDLKKIQSEKQNCVEEIPVNRDNKNINCAGTKPKDENKKKEVGENRFLVNIDKFVFESMEEDLKKKQNQKLKSKVGIECNNSKKEDNIEKRKSEQENCENSAKRISCASTIEMKEHTFVADKAIANVTKNLFKEIDDDINDKIEEVAVKENKEENRKTNEEDIQNIGNKIESINNKDKQCTEVKTEPAINTSFNKQIVIDEIIAQEVKSINKGIKSKKAANKKVKSAEKEIKISKKIETKKKTTESKINSSVESDKCEITSDRVLRSAVGKNTVTTPEKNDFKDDDIPLLHITESEDMIYSCGLNLDLRLLEEDLDISSMDESGCEFLTNNLKNTTPKSVEPKKISSGTPKKNNLICTSSKRKRRKVIITMID